MTFDYDAFSADLMSSKQNLTHSFMTFLLGKYISTGNKNVSEHRRVSEEDIWMIVKHRYLSETMIHWFSGQFTTSKSLLVYN